MAAIAGRLGELWTQTGTSTTMTTEACTVVSGTTYDIDNGAKRQMDPAATTIVYDGGSPVAADLYTVQYAAGRIVFVSAPAGAVTVSGKYFATAQLGYVTNWKLDVKPFILETTALGDTARTYIGCGFSEWSGSWESFREAAIGSAAWVQSNDTYQSFIVKLYENEPADMVWLGTIIFSGWNGEVALTELVKQSIDFVGVGDPVYVSSET